MEDEFAALAEAVSDVSAGEASQVRFVLAEARRRDVPFEDAWFWALRSISPPRTCTVAVRARVDEARALIHETKPLFRAAYERRELTLPERLAISDAPVRRLRDLPKVA